jgi:hypothetical protein
MMRRSCLLPVAAVAALGCGSEVGKEYKGEVLLEFRGSVTSDVPITDDSVLVLTYNTGRSELLIDGVIEGDFPSAFRFSTTKPPPGSDEEDLAGNGELVKVAWFGLAAVPANHPAILPSVAPTVEVDYSNPAVIHVTRTYYGGTSPFNQDLSCQATPCQLLDSEGDDASVLQAEQTVGNANSSWFPNDAGFYSASITCDAYAANKCYRDVYRCDTSALGKNDFVYEPDQIFTCTVNQESGDPTLPGQSLYTSVKANFSIVWVSQDVNDQHYGPYGPLKAGYNIVQDQSSLAAWLNSWKCIWDRNLAAMARYNAAHGTSYPPYITYYPFGTSPPDPNPQETEEISAIQAQIESQCAREAGTGVVTDSMKQNLAIEILHTARLAEK